MEVNYLISIIQVGLSLSICTYYIEIAKNATNYVTCANDAQTSAKREIFLFLRTFWSKKTPQKKEDTFVLL